MAKDAMLFQWLDGAMVPTPRARELAEERFFPRANYWLSVEPERTEKTHNHEFAWIHEAWKTLPESIAHHYPSSEFLRKRALIQTGHCTVQDYVCTSMAEADRWAKNLRRELDEYALIIPSETVVRVYRAKSQSRKAMGAAAFQQSKTDILNWISDLIGVTPEALTQARAA